MTAGVRPGVEAVTVIGSGFSEAGSMVGSWSIVGAKVGAAHAIAIAIAKAVNTPVFKSL